LNAKNEPAFGADSVVAGYLDTAALKARFEKLLAP
jgi:hypothetical protein